MQCLSKNLKVYLPPSTASLDGDVGVVFGEQHLDSEDSHRGRGGLLISFTSLCFELLVQRWGCLYHKF